MVHPLCMLNCQMSHVFFDDKAAETRMLKQAALAEDAPLSVIITTIQNKIKQQCGLRSTLNKRAPGWSTKCKRDRSRVTFWKHDRHICISQQQDRCGVIFHVKDRWNKLHLTNGPDRCRRHLWCEQMQSTGNLLKVKTRMLLGAATVGIRQQNDASQKALWQLKRLKYIFELSTNSSCCNTHFIDVD